MIAALVLLWTAVLGAASPSPPRLRFSFQGRCTWRAGPRAGGALPVAVPPVPAPLPTPLCFPRKTPRSPWQQILPLYHPLLPGKLRCGALRAPSHPSRERLLGTEPGSWQDGRALPGSGSRVPASPPSWPPQSPGPPVRCLETLLVQARPKSCLPSPQGRRGWLCTGWAFAGVSAHVCELTRV